MTDVEPTNARCPRCGYDQRGVIAAWRDSCPLQGTCSECGLTIIWAEVLVPEKFEPQWCVEFVPGFRQVVRAAATTLMRSFWPVGFWSQLKMSQPIRWRRLAVYVALLLLPLLFTYVLAQSALALRMRYLVQQQVATDSVGARLQLRYEQMHLDALIAAKASKSMSDQERAVAFQQAPPGFDMASDYHGFVMSLARTPDDALDSLIARKKASVTNLQARVNTPPRILISHLGAMIEAVVFPIRQFSTGTIQFADGSITPYPAPRKIYELIGGVRSGAASWSDDLSFRFLLTLASVLGLLALMPVSFVLLPVSRHRAKVRWAHVMRIVIYSTFAMITTIVATTGVTAWYLLADSALALRLFGAITPAAWIGITLWWAAAIKRYLKMPHAGAVAWVMSLMLALLLSPLLINVLPQWIVRLVVD